MMELIPPVGASQLATKRDLDELERRLDARFVAFGGRFDEQEARFDAKLEAVRSSMLRTLGTWLFVSQAAVIASVGAFT